jgi:hypothetical protein
MPGADPVWPVPGCAVGIAFPGAVPTDGEPGWVAGGAAWSCVGAGMLPAEPGFGADGVLPEPVPCASADPTSSVATPAIASGVNHKCLMSFLLWLCGLECSSREQGMCHRQRALN